MQDWNEQLDKKSQELNIEGGAENGQKTDRALSSDRVGSNRSSNSIVSNKNSSNSDNSIRSGSRNLLHRSISKEVNKNQEKGGKLMISDRDADKDLKQYEDEATDVNTKAIIKAMRTVVKFLSTMRSNQLLTEPQKEVIRKRQEARRAEEPKKKTE